MHAGLHLCYSHNPEDMFSCHNPIYTDTISMGLSIVYFNGSQVEFMKCSNMLHFIWVFTVCQSTCLGASSIQRAKYQIIQLIRFLYLIHYMHSHYLRNEFDFLNVHGIMNTSGLLKGFTLALQETRSIHDSMNIPKIKFIAYIYIFL